MSPTSTASDVRRCPVCLEPFRWDEAWYLVPAPENNPEDAPEELRGTYYQLCAPDSAAAGSFRTSRRAVAEKEPIAICPSPASLAVKEDGALLQPPWRTSEVNAVGMGNSVDDPWHVMDPAYGQVDSLFIPVLGGPQTGKTSLMVAMAGYRWHLADEARGYEVSLEPRFGKLWETFVKDTARGVRGPVIEMVKGTAGVTGWQLYFRLTVVQDGASRELNLIFADYAGEDLRDDGAMGNKARRTRNVGIADAVMCVASAVEFPTVQRRLRDKDGRQVRVRAEDDIMLLAENRIVDHYHDMHRDAISPVPAAYVLNKADLLQSTPLFGGGYGYLHAGGAPPGSGMASLYHYLEQATPQRGRTRVTGAFVPDKAKVRQTSMMVGGFVRNHLEADGRLIQLLSQSSPFAPVSFHAVSALTGAGVFEPLLTLLYHRGLLTPRGRGR